MTKSKWDLFVAKYLFMFKDGFFELPYLANSPQIMVDSLIKNPVSNHKLLEQGIFSNNLFCKGTMYYREMEDNFWLLTSHIEIKKNIIAKSIYDENFASEFYILTFSVFEHEFPVKNATGQNIKITNTCWTLSKPKTEVQTYFYQTTKGKFYNLVFDKKWADETILIKNSAHNTTFQAFLDGKTGSFTWSNRTPEANEVAKIVSEIILSEKDGVFHIQELRKNCLTLIDYFVDNVFDDNRIAENVSLSNLNYAKIAKAEKMISLNLSVPFVGVEEIASEVMMSPTKLKTYFKTVFGYSMLQYHKEQNMLLAMQLVQNSTALINVIAAITGYDSASKFAATFKKRFGKLPSEFRN
ncbi:helix-turn-helix domain-containing protein [Flavobacterium restrictum]|uniref:Helix-turn-helix transcriptional regulator n=1 Tax=Flavobacterium restrictum TaxID=2594428 RepID=A0A553EAX8_9FLAO|nr:AraC family transcriptional regulator [Flavobacterium restrictum]TRX42180.1 helix-turn-helix transcriptional regulator [Flavobacterium restrictum]